MAQWLGALTTDPMVRVLSPWHDQTFSQSEESHQLSVIPGIGITRCGHIERKNSISISVQKLPSDAR